MSGQPTLADHRSAYRDGRTDAYYDAARPRVAVTDPVRTAYMLGWTEGKTLRSFGLPLHAAEKVRASA